MYICIYACICLRMYCIYVGMYIDIGMNASIYVCTKVSCIHLSMSDCWYGM